MRSAAETTETKKSNGFTLEQNSKFPFDSLIFVYFVNKII
jgi:hypothetical protein